MRASKGALAGGSAPLRSRLGFFLKARLGFFFTIVLMTIVPLTFFVIQAAASGPPVAQNVAASPAPVAEKRALIDEALALSGAKRQVEQFTSKFKFDSQTLPPDLSFAPLARLQSVFTEVFRSDRLYELVVAHFMEQSESDAMLSKLAWLRSPLAGRLSQLEIDADEHETERNAFKRELASKPPSNQRKALFQRLEAAYGGPDSAIQLVDTTMTTLVKLMAALMSAKPKALLDGAQSNAQLDTLRADPVGDPAFDKDALRAALSEEDELLFAYAFRNVSDADLEAYVKLYESESGRWFVKTFNEALLGAIESVGKKSEPVVRKAQPLRALQKEGMAESERNDAIRLLQEQQKAEQAFNSGRIDEALEMLQAVAAESERLGSKFHPVAAVALNQAAEIHEKLGRFEEARGLRLRVVQLHKAYGKPGSIELASYFLDLAKNFQLEHRNDDALKCFREAVNISEAGVKSGATDPETQGAHITILIGALLEMAAIGQQRGIPAASEVYERALSLAEQLREPEMVDIMVEAYSMMLRDAGQTAEAESIEQRGKAIRGKLRK